MAQKDSLFTTSSPAFIIFRFFDNGHSNWFEAIPVSPSPPHPRTFSYFLNVIFGCHGCRSGAAECAPDVKGLEVGMLVNTAQCTGQCPRKNGPQSPNWESLLWICGLKNMWLFPDPLSESTVFKDKEFIKLFWEFEEGLSEAASLAVRTVVRRASRGTPLLFLFLEHGCQAVRSGRDCSLMNMPRANDPLLWNVFNEAFSKIQMHSLVTRS